MTRRAVTSSPTAPFTPTPMPGDRCPPARHLAALAADSATLVAMARSDLGTPVEHCPGWTMTELLTHTGGGHRWVEAHLRAFVRGEDPDAVVVERLPPGRDVVEWFEEGAARLVATLAELDPADTVGTAMWNLRRGGYFPSASLYRHQAKETGVHRWDAELARGRASAFDDGLAAEWIDDTLVWWLPGAAAGGRQAQGSWSGETFHLWATPPDRHWLVRVERPGVVTVGREPGPADVSVRGPASDLLLLVMNRTPAGGPRLVATGDTSLFARWAAGIRYGTAAGRG